MFDEIRKVANKYTLEEGLGKGMQFDDIANQLSRGKEKDHVSLTGNLLEKLKHLGVQRDLNIYGEGLSREALGNALSGMGGATVGGAALPLGLSRLIKKIKNPKLRALGYLGSAVGGGITGALGGQLALKGLMGDYNSLPDDPHPFL